MTLTQLDVFIVVAARLNFTHAALQLGISQSAVSHAIKSLENELGVSLFIREQNQVQLSDIGQRLLKRAQSILGTAETMRQEALDAKGLKKGSLHIGSFGPTASVSLLPPLLAAFRQHYPGIEVHIDEAHDEQVIGWLQARRVDVGFVTLPNEQFDTYPVLHDQMVALLPRNHALAQANSVSLKQLCGHPFSLTQAGSADIIMRLFTAQKLQPCINYRTLQTLSTLALVARGEAVSIMAESALPAQIGNDIVTRPLNPPVTRTVALALLDKQNASPAALAFVKLARDYGQDTATNPKNHQ